MARKYTKERQKKISNVVIGIAGCGGIGGALAERLVRLGVRHIKIADPDYFDLSNINRQYGASLSTIGKNKAEVVGESIFNISRDVNVDIFPEGINDNTADEFVEGCDYVLDKIELFELEARYALHDAFKTHSRCKFMLTVPVFGHRAFFFKWTKDSMSAKDYFNIKPGSKLDEHNTRKIVYSLFPEYPQFPSKEKLDEWLIHNKECPIFAG